MFGKWLLRESLLKDSDNCDKNLHTQQLVICSEYTEASEVQILREKNCCFFVDVGGGGGGGL